MDLIENNKTAIVFLSGSSGELDWMLPILDKLLKKNFCLKIVFLRDGILAEGGTTVPPFSGTK